MDLAPAIPRLGWIDAPSPVQALPAPGGRTRWLGVKRDDLLPALFGGAKPRKLDTLLAQPPWRDARGLASVGAIGSGHLVACVATGEKLGKPVLAHTFWEPVTPHALENLGYVATRATLKFHASRVSMALTAPRALLGSHLGDYAVVPAGGTNAPGSAGIFLAGLELAEQVRTGVLPAPDRVYVALGSGGNAVGLSVGLGAAGLRTEVRAVATVERPFATAGRIAALQRALVAWLRERGVDPGTPAPLTIDRSQLGGGYGVPTHAAWEAVVALQEAGVPAEPVYTGKAWAALAADVAAGRAGEHVLFWHTSRRGPLPVAEGWRAALPPALRRRIANARVFDGTVPGNPGVPAVSRRGLLVGGAAILAAAGGAVRVSGYAAYPAWEGSVLWAWEAEVLRAAAAAILPPAPVDDALLQDLPIRVDRFLRTLPERALLEIHGLFVLIEHGTGVDLRLARFTRMDPEARVAFLERLDGLGPGHLAAKGLRDLVLCGYYQDAASWADTGYGGPLVGPDRPAWPAYEHMRAPDGAVPATTVRT